MSTRSRDRGQAVPIVVGVAAVLAVLAVAIARFGAGLHDAARARTAADAAALAGVEGGRSDAAALAAANGGVLESFRREGDDVVVVVQVGRARASARATNGP
jgi:hypothetical protein